MDRAALAAWLERYEAAWRSNDPELIGDLFTTDAVYQWHPYDEGDAVAHGRDAIVRAWLDDPDDPRSWELTCEPVAADGDTGVARCVTRYRDDRTYHNIFIVRLDESGRCFDFTEYYMLEPRPAE